MKQILWRGLIVSSLTLIILAPALSIFGLLWLQNHADAVGRWQILLHLETIARTIVELFLLATLALCLRIPLYQAYSAYRAAVFKKRVETLERLWQLSIYR